MGVALVAGCALIAFGPSLMLWAFVVAKRPALVIIAIVSAFSWLASISVASLLWTMVPPAQDVWMLTVTVGVALQGFGRLVLAHGYMKTERIINEVQTRDRGPITDRRRSGSREGPDAGESRENGDDRRALLKLNGLSSSIAITAAAFVLLDLVLMGAVFSYARSGAAKLLSWSFGLHYLAALTTGFNYIDGGCVASLPLLYGVVVFSVVVVGRLGVFSLNCSPRTHTR